MYSIKLVGFALPVLTLVLAAPAGAHHPSVSLGVGTAGPIMTRTADTLPAGRWSVSAQMQFLKLDDISDGQLEHLAEQGIEGVHGIETILSTQFGVAYGLFDSVTVSATLPVVRRSNIDEGHPEAPGVGEVEKLGDSAGLGDLAVMATWQVMDGQNQPFAAAVMAGVKTPTGDTHDRSDDGSERFEAEFQPGSGSWDPLLGGAASAQWGPVTLAASVLFQMTAEGSQGTDLGDGLMYDLAAAYRLMGGGHSGHDHDDHSVDRHGAIDLVLEINGEWRGKEETSGMKDPHSGGNTIYFSPGVRYVHPAGGSAWVSVGVPIAEDLNGNQADTDVRVSVGVAQMF